MDKEEIVGYRIISGSDEAIPLNKDDVKKAIEYKDIIMGLDKAGDQLKNINEKINSMLENNSNDEEFVNKVNKIYSRINELINYQTQLMIMDNINQVGKTNESKND